MATSIKTIKNHLTDDTIYPVTKANAVYLSDNVTTVEGLLGDTSITSIGDGTITGAISALNNDLIITIPFETTLSNIPADAASYTNINYTLPSGYTPIGATCWQPDLHNRFVIWVGSILTTSISIMYINLRTSSDNCKVKGLVFCQKT